MQRASLYIVPIAFLAAAACGGPEAAQNARSLSAVPGDASLSAASPSAASNSTPASAPDTRGDSASVPVSSSPLSPSPVLSPDVAAPTSATRPSPDMATTAASPAASPTADDAAAILERAEQAYSSVRSFEADFVQYLSVPLLNQTQTSRGKMYHRRPDRFLMKFTDPAGDIVVADGTYLWLYYPSNDAKQVIRASLANGRQQVDLQREFLSDPTSRFDATLDGSESVNGRPAYVVTLTPKQDSPYKKVRLWIDKQDALVRRFEITEQNESVRKLDLSGLKVNVSLPDELFDFTPPAGTEVFDQ